MSDRPINGTQNGTSSGHGQRFASIDEQTAALQQQWDADPRWANVERTYSAADVVRLRGSVQEQHTLARAGRGAAVGHAARRRATSTPSAR